MPELDLEVSTGTLGGLITTVEGLLDTIAQNLKSTRVGASHLPMQLEPSRRAKTHEGEGMQHVIGTSLVWSGSKSMIKGHVLGCRASIWETAQSMSRGGHGKASLRRLRGVKSWTCPGRCS